MSTLQNIKRRREYLKGYLLVLPAGLLMIIFVLYPLGHSFFLSFTEYSLIYSEKPVFVGLDNYFGIFSDEYALIAIKNTAFFMLLFLPMLILFGLIIALMVNEKVPGSNLAIGVVFLPIAIPLSIAGVMFLWLYDWQFGLVNFFLEKIGLGAFRRSWLVESEWVLPAMGVVKLWKNCGLSLIIFLAGMQSIPVTLYEAARMDGVSRWQSFFYITLPLLRESFILVLIWGTIESWKVFALPFVMTKGGPGTSSLTLYLFTYRESFEFYHMGRGSALAIFLALIIVSFSIVISKVLKEREAGK